MTTIWKWSIRYWYWHKGMQKTVYFRKSTEVDYFYELGGES